MLQSPQYMETSWNSCQNLSLLPSRYKGFRFCCSSKRCQGIESVFIKVIDDVVNQTNFAIYKRWEALVLISCLFSLKQIKKLYHYGKIEAFNVNQWNVILFLNKLGWAWKTAKVDNVMFYFPIQQWHKKHLIFSVYSVLVISECTRLFFLLASSLCPQSNWCWPYSGTMERNIIPI